jgi:hypothetical protein
MTHANLPALQAAHQGRGGAARHPDPIAPLVPATAHPMAVQAQGDAVPGQAQKLTVAIVSEPQPVCCSCECHQSGAIVLHAFPCCAMSGIEYIEVEQA